VKKFKGLEMSSYDKAYANPRSILGRFSTWFENDCVCVLTIGKTASSAIIDGLHEADVNAFQVHSLVRSPQSYLFVKQTKKHRIRNAVFKIKISFWMLLQKNSPRKFIVIFRDPFERNLSAFFEQMWRIEGLSINDDVNKLLNGFVEHGAHDATRTWFQENIHQKFNIDYSDLHFDEKPWCTHERKNKKFLFIKYEQRECWESAISDFVGARIHLKRKNDSANKPYAEKIKTLKSLWCPTEEVIKRTVDLDLWEVLYTPKEKAEISKKWSIAVNFDV